MQNLFTVILYLLLPIFEENVSRKGLDEDEHVKKVFEIVFVHVSERYRRIFRQLFEFGF